MKLNTELYYTALPYSVKAVPVVSKNTNEPKSVIPVVCQNGTVKSANRAPI